MKFKDPNFLKDGESVVMSGEDAHRTWVCIRRSDGSLRYVNVTPEDMMKPLPSMPGYIAWIRASMPELPQARRERYQSDFGLSVYDSQVLTSGPEISDYFDELVEYCGDGKAACNWVMGSWMALLKRDGLEIKECPVSSENLGELINLVMNGILTHNLAKQILEKMWEEKLGAKEIIQKYDMVQKQDSGELEKIVDKVISEDNKAVEEFKKGKLAIIGHFVGKVMKETKGKANPKIVNEMVKIKLESM